MLTVSRPALGLLALGVLAGSLAPAQALHARAATPSVQILKDSYTPQAITVAVGETVTWTNVDTTPGNGHTVTSSGRGPLKSSSMSQGGTFSYTFTTAGTFAYYCAIHPDMTGTVTVR
jgi:plastocyanin